MTSTSSTSKDPGAISVLAECKHEEMVNNVNKAMEFKQATPFLKLMLRAMIDVGCPIDNKRHIVVETCKPYFKGLAATDTSTNQIIICEDAFNKISNKTKLLSALDVNLTHELLHLYDHCRANIDFYNNPSHKMCSEIRAAALCGVCAGLGSFPKTPKSHQKCVKRVAMQSFRMMEPSFTDAESSSLMSEVFPSCYGDHEPFDRIPVSTEDARSAYKAYLNRNRYSL